MTKETKPRKPRSSTKKSKSELEAKIAPPKPKEEPKPKEKPKPEPPSVSSGEVAPAYATVSSTGYTGNRYYATRARLSYHPPDKQFKGESVATVQKSAPPPTPAPEPEPQYTYRETTSSQQKSKSSSWLAKGAREAEGYAPEPRSSTKKSPSELEAKIAELEEKLRQLYQLKSAEVRTGMAPPKPKEEPKPKEKPKPEPPSVSSGEVAPAYATVSSTGYTGNRYYATRARLSYHPPDKQFKG